MAHSEKSVHSVRIGRQGRVVIPVGPRQVLGLRPGDTLVLWVEGDRLVLRPRRAVEEELWAQFGDLEASLSDELVSDRRRESQREAQG